MKRTTLKLERILRGVPYPSIQLDFMFLSRKGYTCIGWNLFMDTYVSGNSCVRKTNREKDCGESLEMGAQYWTLG